MPKNLAELRGKARATAKRLEDRLEAAIGENRDLTADEEAAHTADQGELAGLNEQIAAAEAAGEADGDDGEGVDAPTGDAAVLAAERERVIALMDLCPNSAVASALRTAIKDGKSAGAFAIDLATATKARGATMAQLRKGAVSEDQLPIGGGASAQPGAQAKTGAEKGKATVARLAQLGHSAFKHLIPAK